MRLISFPILLLCCFLTFSVTAQYPTAPFWSFGYHASIDFSAGQPVASVSTATTSQTTVNSSQCDRQGNLLFYTDAINIYNRLHQPIAGTQNTIRPNGTVSAIGMHSAILPDAADSNLYYVFSMYPAPDSPNTGSYFSGMLDYTVIDMQLNNGYGGAVPGKIRVLLDTNLSNFFTLVPGSNCSSWLVTHGFDYPKNNVRAYHITRQGIMATPVISSFPVGISCRSGFITYAYHNNKIFITSEPGDVYTYGFNPDNGVAYNQQLLISATSAPAPLHPMALSPDEHFLYTSYLGGLHDSECYFLLQYPVDLTGPTVTVGTYTEIFHSTDSNYVWGTNIGTFYNFGTDLKLAPDLKIYTLMSNGMSFLGRINNPNLPGIACNYSPQAIMLLPNTFSGLYLPAAAIQLSIPSYKNSFLDTSVCFQPSALLHSSILNADSYIWQNGSGQPSFLASGSGIYSVTSVKGCATQNDSFRLQLIPYNISLGSDTLICYNTLLKTQIPDSVNASYTWQNGNKTSYYLADAPGEYSVTISLDGCTASDTIVVSAALPVYLGTDTTLCHNTEYKLTATYPGTSYLWQDGSIDPTITVRQAGTYYVTITEGFCTGSDTMLAMRTYCDCIISIPGGFTPNNDGKNDFFRPVMSSGCPNKNYTIHIYNRYGELIYRDANTATGWDGTWKGRSADVGTYMYYLTEAVAGKETVIKKGDVALIR